MEELTSRRPLSTAQQTVERRHTGNFNCLVLADPGSSPTCCSTLNASKEFPWTARHRPEVLGLGRTSSARNCLRPHWLLRVREHSVALHSQRKAG